MLRSSDRTSSRVPDISQTVYRILNSMDHISLRNSIVHEESVEGWKDWLIL